jgi:Cdc6-like AAA superfamily ATPase
MKSHRIPSDIKAQLAAFSELLPQAANPPSDFAALLQLDAWQAHREALETELAEANAAEAENMILALPSTSQNPREDRPSRSSSDVEAQLKSFLAALPSGIEAPPANDFAAQLQWDAWQAHLGELDSELQRAKEREAEEASKIVLKANPPFEMVSTMSMEHYLPRPTLEKRVVRSLNQGNTILVGSRGVGKTTLARFLSAHVTKERRVVYLDLGRLSSPSSWLFAMARSLGSARISHAFSMDLWHNAVTSFLGEVRRQNCPTWFILDDVDVFLRTLGREGTQTEFRRMLELFRYLRSPSSEVQLRFLLISSDASPAIGEALFWKGGFSRVVVPQLSRSETSRLVQRLARGVGLALSAAIRESIAQMLPGWPIFIAYFIQRLWQQGVKLSSISDVKAVYQDIVANVGHDSIIDEVFERMHPDVSSGQRTLAIHLLKEASRSGEGFSPEESINLLARLGDFQSSGGVSSIATRQISMAVDTLTNEGYLEVSQQSGQEALIAAKLFRDIWAHLQ